MTIDPLSVNRQGGDVGTQYRTGIYYEEYHQKYLVLDFIDNPADCLISFY